MVMYLIKEGDSGNPADWMGDSRLRPLTSEGQNQAKRLVSILEGWPLDGIVTGPCLRSHQTVLALAHARALKVRCEPALGEIADIGRALTLVRRLACGAGGPLLVCAQATLIDGMVGLLAGEGSTMDDAVLPAADFVWVFGEATEQATHQSRDMLDRRA
jgi:8-oxo-(d)GTP phosphatase